MKTQSKVCFAVMLALCAAATAGTAQAEFSLAATVGARKMSNPSWQSLESQWLLGLAGYYGADGSPLTFTVGAMGSASGDPQDDGSDRSVDVTDVNAGVRLMSRRGHVRPYVEAGISRLEAGYEESVHTCAYVFACTEHVISADEDSSAGFWVGTGLAFRSARGLQLGIDVRWLGGTHMTLLDHATDVDGFTGQIVMGFTTGGIDQPRRSRAITVPPSSTKR